MTWSSRNRTDRDKRGLSLLEVLAAAMIFAMVMTVLIGTSSTAVHNVGVSARRLEANLVADEILADLEIQMKQGIAPEIDENESTREQYAIRVFRTDLSQEPDAANPGGSAINVASMLGSDLPEVAKHLKQYDIEVSWIEQNGPQRVTRTTFAFDWQNAAIEFSELFARNDRSGPGTGRGDGNGNGSNSGSGGMNDGGSMRGGSQRGARTGDGILPGAGRAPGGGGHNARQRHFENLEDPE
jgi:hypothetical protein